MQWLKAELDVSDAINRRLWALNRRLIFPVLLAIEPAFLCQM